MSIKEILEELPKLTQEEKKQLWNALNHEVSHDVEEERPELLAAIDEGIRSLESGEQTYTVEEARQLVSEFKFRHNVNTLALSNSPVVRPSYR